MAPNPIKLAAVDMLRASWKEVKRIEAQIHKLDYKLGDYDRVRDLLGDLNEARATANCWQSIVDHDRGWV
jgi:hypothetical protein